MARRQEGGTGASQAWRYGSGLGQAVHSTPQQTANRSSFHPVLHPFGHSQTPPSFCFCQLPLPSCCSLPAALFPLPPPSHPCPHLQHVLHRLVSVLRQAAPTSASRPRCSARRGTRRPRSCAPVGAGRCRCIHVRARAPYGAVHGMPVACGVTCKLGKRGPDPSPILTPPSCWSSCPVLQVPAPAPALAPGACSGSASSRCCSRLTAPPTHTRPGSPHLDVLGGGLVAHPADDERRARLVNEDGVHLINDAEVEGRGLTQHQLGGGLTKRRAGCRRGGTDQRLRRCWRAGSVPASVRGTAVRNRRSCPGLQRSGWALQACYCSRY